MLVFFFFKQKTAYEMRISDWSSDVCSSDLTKGATTTTYAPRANVTRRQMSLFVQRLADLLDSLETGEPELEELPEYDPAELSCTAIGRASCRERVCQYV